MQPICSREDARVHYSLLESERIYQSQIMWFPDLRRPDAAGPENVLCHFLCSCFANAALQCLMATRPMGAYLASGLHSSRGCPAPKGAFCPLCRLERLARAMAADGDGPASAQPLLSQVQLFCRDMVAGEQVTCLPAEPL